jgi:hypothetical protein
MPPFSGKTTFPVLPSRDAIKQRIKRQQKTNKKENKVKSMLPND